MLWSYSPDLEPILGHRAQLGDWCPARNRARRDARLASLTLRARSMPLALERRWRG
jgi:hypothetical protein